MSITVLTNQIASVFIHCTVMEEVVTELRRSQYVVEEGVDITDHAHFAPTLITIDGKISNHDINSRSYDSGLISREYQALVNLQKSHQRIEIFTGISLHTNMVLDKLRRTRTNQFGQVLEFVATFSNWRVADNPEIVTAIAASGSGGNGGTGVGAAAGTASTSTKSGTADAGNSQTQPTKPAEDNSAAFDIFGL